MVVKSICEPNAAVLSGDEAYVAFVQKNHPSKVFLEGMGVRAVECPSGESDYLDVTFKVKPEEAEQLYLAQSLGELRLVVHAKDK